MAACGCAGPEVWRHIPQMCSLYTVSQKQRTSTSEKWANVKQCNMSQSKCMLEEKEAKNPYRDGKVTFFISFIYVLMFCWDWRSTSQKFCRSFQVVPELCTKPHCQTPEPPLLSSHIVSLKRILKKSWLHLLKKKKQTGNSETACTWRFSSSQTGGCWEIQLNISQSSCSLEKILVLWNTWQKMCIFIVIITTIIIISLWRRLFYSSRENATFFY